MAIWYSTPKRLLKREAHYQQDIDKAIAKACNTKWDKYVEQYLFIDKDKYANYVVSTAKDRVKERLIAHMIADENGIKLSKEEYDKYIEKRFGKKVDEEQFKSENGISFSEYTMKKGMKEDALVEKVQSFLYKNAVKKPNQKTKGTKDKK